MNIYISHTFYSCDNQDQRNCIMGVDCNFWMESLEIMICDKISHLVLFIVCLYCHSSGARICFLCGFVQFASKLPILLAICMCSAVWLLKCGICISERTDCCYWLLMYIHITRGTSHVMIKNSTAATLVNVQNVLCKASHSVFAQWVCLGFISRWGY